MLTSKDFNLYAIVSSIALAMLLFYVGRTFPSLQQVLRSAGYVGTFVLGFLYVYSFTSLPAAALLVIISKTQNLWMAGTIATIGAVLGDLVLFGLFRSAKRFAEDHGPPQERYARWWKAITARIPPPWQPVALVALVLTFLVLPLPNEFADFLLARIRKVRTSAVVVVSYVGNGIGLYAIAWLARFG
jgi:membrane protein YqaA with SNARE-associated domain